MKHQRQIALAALSVFIFLFFSESAKAQALSDPGSAEALEKTTALLRDQSQREKAISESPDAKKNHADLKELAGSEENINGAYGISANIFEKMVRDSGGDVSLMQKMIEKAQRDPSSFYESLTPDQKKNIDALAKQIESSKSNLSAAH